MILFFRSIGSSIYLLHNQKCYLNGSYFYDNDIKGDTNSIKCILPNSILSGGEWVTPGPSGSSINCNINTDPLHCNIVSSPAAISLYRPRENPQTIVDGWYKCCLPTDCSDSNTNIIFANIFSKRRL